MHLRPLRSEDRPYLLELLQGTAEFTSAEVACAIELLDLAITQPERGEYRVLVAGDENDRPMGYACYGATPMTEQTWDLYWIAARADSRGRGVGRALLALVEADVLDHGGRIVRIETSAKDAYGATRAFYERTNYRPAGQINDFYRPGDHLVTLTKDLAALPAVVGRTADRSARA
jgi:GNAT superfamily N-acetyltransferase